VALLYGSLFHTDTTVLHFHSRDVEKIPVILTVSDTVLPDTGWYRIVLQVHCEGAVESFKSLIVHVCFSAWGGGGGNSDLSGFGASTLHITTCRRVLWIEIPNVNYL
jgi:hypothetical protein